MMRQTTVNLPLTLTLVSVSVLGSCNVPSPPIAAPLVNGQTKSMAVSNDVAATTTLGNGIDACGWAPEPITYDRSFIVAEATLRKQTASTTVNVNGIVPIDAIPVDISGSGSNLVSKEEIDHMNVNDALHIVQATINNQRQAIIAECGYRMCHIPSGSDPADLIRLQSLGDICSSAILNTPYDNSSPTGASTFIFVPKSRMVIFKDGEQKTSRSLTLQHIAPGSITIQAPPDTDPGNGDSAYAKYTGYIGAAWVWLLGIPKNITLSGSNDEKIVTFEMTKPVDTEDAKQISPLIFKASDDNSKTASANFLLIPSGDYFTPPPTLSCPLLNPRLEAWAYRPFNKPQETATANADSFSNISDTREAFITNNSPIGHAKEYGECTDITPAGARTQVIGHYATNFEITSGLQGGDTHPDANQSAGGYAEPTWRVEINLPGPPARYIYTLKSTFQSQMRASCTMGIDALASTTIVVGENKPTPATLSPGKHILSISCPRFGGSTSWNTTERNALTFDLDVERTVQSNLTTASLKQK